MLPAPATKKRGGKGASKRQKASENHSFATVFFKKCLGFEQVVLVNKAVIFSKTFGPMYLPI